MATRKNTNLAEIQAIDRNQDATEAKPEQDLLQSLFWTVTETEYYEIEFTDKECKFIARKSPTTVSKLINANIIEPDENNEKVVLKLEKLYSVSGGEAGTSQKKYGAKLIADLRELKEQVKEELGVTDKQAGDYLSQEDKINSLPQHLKAALEESFADSADEAQANNKVSLITSIMRSRKYSKWNDNDTCALPARIFDELFYFCEQERNSWEIEEQQEDDKDDKDTTEDSEKKEPTQSEQQ